MYPTTVLLLLAVAFNTTSSAPGKHADASTTDAVSNNDWAFSYFDNPDHDCNSHKTYKSGSGTVDCTSATGTSFERQIDFANGYTVRFFNDTCEAVSSSNVLVAEMDNTMPQDACTNPVAQGFGVFRAWDVVKTDSAHLKANNDWGFSYFDNPYHDCNSKKTYKYGSGTLGCTNAAGTAFERQIDFASGYTVRFFNNTCETLSSNAVVAKMDNTMPQDTCMNPVSQGFGLFRSWDVVKTDSAYLGARQPPHSTDKAEPRAALDWQFSTFLNDARDCKSGETKESVYGTKECTTISAYTFQRTGTFTPGYEVRFYGTSRSHGRDYRIGFLDNGEGLNDCLLPHGREAIRAYEMVKFF